MVIVGLYIYLHGIYICSWTPSRERERERAPLSPLYGTIPKLVEHQKAVTFSLERERRERERERRERERKKDDFELRSHQIGKKT